MWLVLSPDATTVTNLDPKDPSEQYLVKFLYFDWKAPAVIHSAADKRKDS